MKSATVLAIPGLPGDQRTWSRVAPLLPEGMRLKTVERPDLLEFDDGSAFLDACEARLDAALAEVAADGEPVVIAGLSLGAYFATRRLHAYSGKVSGAVLCAGFAGLSAEAAALRRDLGSKLDSGELTVRSLLAMLESLWGDAADRDEASNRLITEMCTMTTDRFSRACRFSAIIVDPGRWATPFSVPTTLLHSRGDRAVPWEDGAKIASLAGHAEIVQIDGTSHFLPLTHPHAVAAAIVRRIKAR